MEHQGKIQTEDKWYFSSVLEGRAVQDVWIVPKRSERVDVASKETKRYGSTMRFYDPAIKVWWLNWVNPVSGINNQLIAKKVGNDIIQG